MIEVVERKLTKKLFFSNLPYGAAFRECHLIDKPLIYVKIDAVNLAYCFSTNSYASFDDDTEVVEVKARLEWWNK